MDEHNFAKHGDSLARGFPVNTTGWRAKVVRGLLQRSQCTEMHMDKRCRYMQQAMQHAMSTSTDNTQLHKTSVQNCLFDQRRNVRQALQQLHSKGAQQWYTAMVRSGFFWLARPLASSNLRQVLKPRVRFPKSLPPQSVDEQRPIFYYQDPWQDQVQVH